MNRSADERSSVRSLVTQLSQTVNRAEDISGATECVYAVGYLQFIIFGLKTREKDYGGAYPGHCARCDNEAYMHAFK